MSRTDPVPGPQADPGWSRGPIGVLAAMPGELGALLTRAEDRRRAQGLVLLRLELAGREVLATACGVGKAAAAQGAAVLLERGATGVLVVGTCGGLRRGLATGTLVHCETAFQVDLAVRETRQAWPDPGLVSLWSGVAPGPRGWFLTADRPVLTPWRRLRLARAFAGPCVADMETASAAAVCARAGVPWAALRAVTDGAGLLSARAFQQNYPAQAGRAADSVESLLGALPDPPGDPRPRIDPGRSGSEGGPGPVPGG